MVAVHYPATPAIDPRTEQVAERGATGQVVAAGTTTPLTITEDRDGLFPIQDAQLAVTGLFLVPPFWCQDGTVEAEWISGEYRVPLYSMTGLKGAADDAAAAAAASAEQAATHVQEAANVAAQATADELSGTFATQAQLSEVATGDPIAVTDASMAAVVDDAASAFRGRADKRYESMAPAPSGTDDLTALNAVLSASSGKVVRLQRGASYTVSAALSVPTGVTLDGNGATITQTGTGKTTLSLSGSNITVRNLRLVGKATDYVSGGATVALAIVVAAGSDNIAISNVRMTGHAGAGVKVLTSTNVRITDCTIVGTNPATMDGAQYGVWVDASSSRVTVAGCDISGLAQGIITGITVTDLTIRDNHIHDIPGQHGMYIQNATRCIITGNTVRNIYLHCIKLQMNTATTTDSVGVIVANNSLGGSVNAGGLVITNIDTQYDYWYSGVVVTGNEIDGVAGSAIHIDSVKALTVTGNMLSGATQHGIILTNVSDAIVSENVIYGVGRTGIYLAPQTGTDIQRATLRGNTVRNPGGANVANTQYGIYVLVGADVVIESNTVTASNGFMSYGIFFAGGVQESSVWRSNIVTGATAYGARLMAGGAVAEWRGNSFSGVTGPVLNYPTTGRGRRGREEFAATAPAAGTYAAGDIVWNVAPAAGGTVGWVCTTAGSPGTWKTFGTIGA